MRTLSSTLTNNQEIMGRALYQIVLSRAGQSTQTYTSSRIISIQGHIEQEDNQVAIVLLNNSDNALTSIDFEMYKGVISYGYNDTTQGDEDSPCAPLYVRNQRLYSAQGVLVCQLMMVGIPNLLALDLAESELILTEGDARTVKTLMSAVANATLAPYTNYTNYTVTYNSEDNIIDALKPKESFRIGINASRLSKLVQLRNWTGNKTRAEDDGAIHTFNPTISGSTYDREYKLAVSGAHPFFNKELINRFVNPNKEIVSSHPSHQPQFSGSSTSATSFALFPETHTTYLRLASDSQASNIADAIKERYELDAEKGSVNVPMDVGLEVWDYIKVTDSRQGDSREGNVRYIRRDAGGGNFRMEVRFGKSTVLPLPILSPAQGGVRASIADRVDRVDSAYFQLSDDLVSTIEKLNELIGFVNNQSDVGYFRKLTITEELNIPSE